jgi:hypothetical protein
MVSPEIRRRAEVAPGVGGSAGAERHNAGPTRSGRKAGQERRIGRQQGEAVSLNATQDRGLLISDCLDAAEVADVGLFDSGDDGEVRLGQPGERFDFAGMVHADFCDAEGGVRRGTGQGQRHTPVVVVRGNCGVGETSGGEDPAQHLLRSGLAHAAGDGDELAGEAPAGVGAEAGETSKRVIHVEERATRGFGVDHCGGRTASEGIGHMTMAVAMLPGEGDEKVTGVQGAGVD